MRTVILVPRRADHGHRDEVWAWTRAWWEKQFPRWPIFEGHHDDGLFNRAAACNRASAAAGAWDVAVLIDADVICDPEHVREAVNIAHAEQDRLVFPFTRRHNLNQRGTRAVMAGETGSWQSFIGITYNDQCSAVVAIPRKLWDQVGGFDQKFSGWGFEDNAFASACETFGSSLQKVEGEVWHLWHPTAPEGHRRSPSFQANRARSELYASSLGDKEAVHKLMAGEEIVKVEVRERENIPRILHRTVPAETSAEVEGWWRRFGELHPGWTLLTHRDPLNPDEWPLTGKRWAECATGAQKAGLIRLEALYRWGGIYVDSDCEPYRSLEPLLPLRAFAAWEDARVVPDAVIGAEPEHPAIKACIDLALRRLKQGAWASGPGVTTAVFKGRSDVLLLPPGSLYPYHYTEKQRRGEDHAKAQPWAFMAHHWAGSWLPDKVEEIKASAGISFLIPFRDADGTRTAAKDWILARWKHHYPGAEFCIASDDGVDPFNKSLAVNNAAKLATGDIFVILDADTWIDQHHFERALDLIQRKVAPWVVPARTSYRLKQGISEKIMRLAPGVPWPLIKRSDAESVLPVVGFLHLMTRTAFEAVGGMDERIRGWGGEDTAFTRAMDVVNGRHRKLGGTVYCLWHARPRDAQNNRLWLGQTTQYDADKEALVKQYAKARTRPDMLQLLGMQ